VLAGTLTAKPEANSTKANAIAPIGRRICAGMVLSLNHPATNILAKFDHNTMQIGQCRVVFGAPCCPLCLCTLARKIKLTRAPDLQRVKQIFGPCPKWVNNGL